MLLDQILGIACSNKKNNKNMVHENWNNQKIKWQFLKLRNLKFLS